MIILALHFSCFKLINLLKIHLYDLEIAKLASFPIIGENKVTKKLSANYK